ncbi:hypothetical protein DVS77_10630 [Mycolicibacterium moriokaense]|nr:hypothetical protein DVS77_10630 [Mycolicibacterium moriokaense]
MVTGEFYARVTMCCVTRCSMRPEAIRDKRPACKWLRSSSHNSADQGMTVIKSLCRNLVSSRRRRHSDSKRQIRDICLVGRASQQKEFAGGPY